MKKLNRSAIVAFFDLVEILIRAPDHPMREEKMVDLHTIFINMHHLINEFRPVQVEKCFKNEIKSIFFYVFQARDSVRILQERQIEELSDICKDFKLVKSELSFKFVYFFSFFPENICVMVEKLSMTNSK